MICSSHSSVPDSEDSAGLVAGVADTASAVVTTGDAVLVSNSDSLTPARMSERLGPACAPSSSTIPV